MKSITHLFCLLTLCSFLSTSCSNEELSPIDSQDNISIENRVEDPWWAILIPILIEANSGHHPKSKTRTSTTDADGNVTVVTTVTYGADCVGIGMCLNRGSIVETGDDLYDYDENLPIGDFELDAIFGLSPSGKIVLGMDDTSDPIAKETLFYDNVIHLSPSYMIDNPTILESLGLVEPLILNDGAYEVFEEEDFKYIVIQ